MVEVKIVVIGGGSFLWSPSIIKDIILTKDLSGSTITLMDIDPKALRVMLKLGEKIVKKAGRDFKIEGTTNRREALQGSDYVILTISTGGLETMKYDLEIPRKYGVYQSVGDTTGPGGISRALRTIPVVVNITEDMEDLCPNAWLINYTNPITTLCMAVNKTTKIKTIGLCHGLFDTLHMLQKIFSVRPHEIQVKVGGINHLLWILDLQVKGQDGYALLRDYIDRHGLSISPVALKLFQGFCYLPAPQDRHIAEFFPYFLTEEAEAGKKYGVSLTTISDRLQRRAEIKQNIMKMLSGKMPIEMTKSWEKASDIISAIENRREEIHIMNLPNKGQIANLPMDTVVETFGVVSASGAHGIAVGKLPNGILNTLYPHVIKNELAVEAALTGDRQLALQAMLTDPLVRNIENAKKMLDELLKANAKYLPQFF